MRTKFINFLILSIFWFFIDFPNFSSDFHLFLFFAFDFFDFFLLFFFTSECIFFEWFSPSDTYHHQDTMKKYNTESRWVNHSLEISGNLIGNQKSWTSRPKIPWKIKISRTLNVEVIYLSQKADRAHGAVKVLIIFFLSIFPIFLNFHRFFDFSSIYFQNVRFFSTTFFRVIYPLVPLPLKTIKIPWRNIIQKATWSISQSCEGTCKI